MADHEAFVACSFFSRNVVEVAEDLIGRTIVVRNGTLRAQTVRAMILEVEAYGGADDLASHAAFQPGGKAALMFGDPGIVYVYAAYGVHPCFNIVTGPSGEASAVLLRGILPEQTNTAVLGPGRATRFLSISLDDHGRCCCSSRFEITLQRHTLEIDRTPRIGITRSVDTLWRFAARLN